MPDPSSTPSSTPTSAFAGAVDGPLDRLGGVASARPLLRLSIFWKIFLANLVLAALGIGVGAALDMALHGAGAGTVTVTAVAAGGVLILVAIGVNAILVRLALWPLESLELTARRVGSGEMDARAADSPLADSGLLGVTKVFNQMLDSLSAHRARQQELARRVLESEERERQRIAHELYSGPAQTLAGVLVRLRIAERHLSSGANGSINEIREEVVSALEEIRGVARRLRPPELDELGVRAALEAHARSMTEGRRMDVRFEGDVPPLSRESSLALFRIVQEAITNAVLHSGADAVTVRFTTEKGRVVAEVADDGCGFEPSAALTPSGQSLGLFGMHERAGYVQGELSLESGPGRGTRVRVALPVAPSREPSPVNGTVDRLVDGLVGETELAAAAHAGGRSTPF
ncbi:MAG: sensor histidine kinase [Gemmatimonadetes bacterium]|nr:sensor histidine kinase [Gemmatimonadota bacterium]